MKWAKKEEDRNKKNKKKKNEQEETGDQFTNEFFLTGVELTNGIFVGIEGRTKKAH